jgi:hypothetical protein
LCFEGAVEFSPERCRHFAMILGGDVKDQIDNDLWGILLDQLLLEHYAGFLTCFTSFGRGASELHEAVGTQNIYRHAVVNHLLKALVHGKQIVHVLGHLDLLPVNCFLKSLPRSFQLMDSYISLSHCLSQFVASLERQIRYFLIMSAMCFG